MIVFNISKNIPVGDTTYWDILYNDKINKTASVGGSAASITTSTYTTPSPGYFYCNDWSGSELKGVIMNSAGSEVFHISAKSSATAVFLRTGAKIKTSAAPNTSQQAVFYYTNGE